MPQMGVDYDLNEYDTGPRHARAGLCSRGLLSCLTGRRPGPMRGQNHHCGVSADAHHPVACGACAAWSWSVQARTLSTCGAAAFVPCRIARPPQHSIECALRDARAHISGALQPSACAACDGVARGQDGRLPLSGGGPMPGLPVLVGDAILFLGAFLNADRSLWARWGCGHRAGCSGVFGMPGFWQMAHSTLDRPGFFHGARPPQVWRRRMQAPLRPRPPSRHAWAACL